MAYAVHTSDPFDREVVCYQSTWDDHIVSGHPDMSGHEDEVDRTVRAPDQIRQSAANPRRRVFYRKGILPRPYETHYLRVIVEYPSFPLGGLRKAKIITAFPSTGVREDEAQIWQQT